MGKIYWGRGLVPGLKSVALPSLYASGGRRGDIHTPKPGCGVSHLCPPEACFSDFGWFGLSSVGVCVGGYLAVSASCGADGEGGVPCFHIEVPHTFLLCVVDQVDPCMAEVEHLGLGVLMGWWQCCNSPRRSACSLMSAAKFAAVPLSRGGALPFSPHFQSIRI